MPAPGSSGSLGSSSMPLPRRLSCRTKVSSTPNYLELVARQAEGRNAEEFRREAARIAADHQGLPTPPMFDVPRYVPPGSLIALDSLGGYSQEDWDEDETIKKHLGRMAGSSRRMQPRPAPASRLSVIHEDDTRSGDRVAGGSTIFDEEVLGETTSMNMPSASAPLEGSLPMLGPLTRRIIQQEVHLGYRRDENDFAYFERMVEPILPTDLILVCSTTDGDVSTGIIFSHHGTLYLALGEHFDIRQIASPRTEQEILRILKAHKLPEAREEKLIVLLPEEPCVMFEDVHRQRWVSVQDVHYWAIWTDDGWVEQKCECEYCAKKAGTETAAAPSV